MAADLRIVDGNPVWASQAIVPSRDTVVSPSSRPALAAVSVNSSGVFVYVKVDNTGTVDLGTCTCGPALPAAWGLPTFFGGFLASTTAAQSQAQGGFTFNVSPLGDSISGPGVNFSFGLSASGRRAWAWSPDGRMFAYAGSPNGNDWFLTIVALQAITRSDGTVRSAGQIVAGSNGRRELKLPKTEASLRAVPLQARALDALDRLQAVNRESPLVFPGERGGYVDLHHFRPFQWRPAQRVVGVDPLRRIYDLRHTCATFALRAGISTFDLSRYMGASLTMIDRHYGHLARDGREYAIQLLDALNAPERDPWTLGGRRSSDPPSAPAMETPPKQARSPSPLTDANRRPPPYHSPVFEHLVDSQARDVGGSPGRQLERRGLRSPGGANDS
ncbi:MAG: hypothetical protein M3546_14515 [Actinomycetota bacterium]|nr:hypothetical protein [Actinomycetota bacterium]